MAFKKYPGISLVELLVSFSIVGIIVLLASSVFFAHFRLLSTQQTTIEIESQNRIALQEITNTVRESQEVALSCCTSPVENSTNSVLVLKLASLDISTQEPNPTSSDYIIYKLDPINKTLIRRTVATNSARASGTKVIATGVTALQFRYPESAPVPATSQVTTSVTTTSANFQGRTITDTNTQKAVLRNK